MDALQARLACLRLAADKTSNPDETLAAAKKWSEFVIGDPFKSSKSAGTKGADDHLADRK